tara:strand:+ start:437 stop:1048 length:612 start_codon:yes stop_codon:yes gene_type:complete
MNLEIKISKRRIPYKLSLKYLEKRVNDVKIGKKNELIWILEHPLTYTGGIRSNNDDILDKNINLIKTPRGGKITLHNPGQKIVYFVINLNKRKKDIRKFVNYIEISIIEFLKEYGIKSKSDRKNIGIWVKDKKIGAIGIRVSKWIAFHGCSININNNLNDYKKINPCGLKNNSITSIQNENKYKKLNIESNLRKIFVKNLKEI